MIPAKQIQKEMKEYTMFNFKIYKSINNFNTYYDKKNIVALTIFSSGWKGKYHCIEEWGEYERHHLYTSEEISKTYRIKSFSRKISLSFIN